MPTRKNIKPEEIVPDESVGQQVAPPPISGAPASGAPASGGDQSQVGTEDDTEDSTVPSSDELHEELGAGVERVSCDVFG